MRMNKPAGVNGIVIATLLLILAALLTACMVPALPTPGTPTIKPPTKEARPPLAPTSPDFDLIRLGTITRNLTYCTMDGVELEMDIHFPAEAPTAWAAVMFIHGGGWTSGDKTRGTGSDDIPALVEAGFLAVAVNYRLAPMHSFPAMIEDVRCAVRYLRAHAAELNIDPNRIGAYGGSAGGHLVALLGTSGGEQAAWDVGEYLLQSSRVQAVVDYFGPTDLTEPEFLAGMDDHRLEIFGAADKFDPALALASPVTYVTADDPPMLLIHGDHDTAVPLSQSVALYERLQAVNMDSRLVIVKNAGHGFAKSGDGTMSPTRDEITRLLVDFFVLHLLR